MWAGYAYYGKPDGVTYIIRWSPEKNDVGPLVENPVYTLHINQSSGSFQDIKFKADKEWARHFSAGTVGVGIHCYHLGSL